MKIEEYKGRSDEIIAVKDTEKYQEIEMKKQEEVQIQSQMERGKEKDFEISL